jgi:hypothetical protein
MATTPIARYLTQAGALMRNNRLTVDVVRELRGYSSICRGCNTTYAPYNVREAAAKDWAQRHASGCRAV